MASPEIAATASGRNSGSSIVSAASATNRPLLVMDAKKFGPSPPLPPPPPPPGGETFTAIAIRIGTAARTAMPAQFRRRPKISHSSERRNRGLIGRGLAVASATGASATDIETLPGERHERLLQIGCDDGEPAYRYALVNELRDGLLRRDRAEDPRGGLGSGLHVGHSQVTQDPGGLVGAVGVDAYPGHRAGPQL